jgi:hypothetical protein
MTASRLIVSQSGERRLKTPANLLTAAGRQDAQDGDGQGPCGGLVALADQVQDTVPPKGLGVMDCAKDAPSTRPDTSPEPNEIPRR